MRKEVHISKYYSFFIYYDKNNNNKIYIYRECLINAIEADNKKIEYLDMISDDT